MSVVHEFIQEELRSQRNTISRFIDNNGFNRSGFYRLMNEPFRIKEEDIDKISRSLKLNKTKEQELRLIIKQSISGYSEQEHEEVLRLLYTQPLFIDAVPLDVEFYSTDNERNRTIKSYKDIHGYLNLEKGVQIKIRILNCMSTPALSSLYTFITGLRERIIACDLVDDVKIEIEHVITVGTVNTKAKLALLLNVAHLIQFRDYSVYFHGDVASDPISMNDLNFCDFLENEVIIHEKHKNDSSRSQYFLLKLSNIDGKRDYCFTTKDRNFYGFINARFKRLRADVSKNQRFFTVGAAKLNEVIAKYEKPYRKLLVKRAPCIDNILPSIWKQIFKNTLEEKPTETRRFRDKIDSEQSFAFLSDEAFFDLQTQFIEMRFHENDKSGAINIFDTQAFKNFVVTGDINFANTGDINTKDILLISRDLIKTQLSYIITQIQKYYGDINYQQFYFFKKPNATSHLLMITYDNEGIWILNEQCVDLINANFFFSDPEVAKLMYAVIANSLPSNQVLSKEESLSFLVKLFESIGGTKEDINSFIH